MNDILFALAFYLLPLLSCVAVFLYWRAWYQESITIVKIMLPLLLAGACLYATPTDIFFGGITILYAWFFSIFCIPLYSVVRYYVFTERGRFLRAITAYVLSFAVLWGSLILTIEPISTQLSYCILERYHQEITAFYQLHQRYPTDIYARGTVNSTTLRNGLKNDIRNQCSAELADTRNRPTYPVIAYQVSADHYSLYSFYGWMLVYRVCAYHSNEGIIRCGVQRKLPVEWPVSAF